MDDGHGGAALSPSRPGELFRAFAAEMRSPIEETLQRLLPSLQLEPRELHRAMRHAMFPGGKRLRPLLALMACRASGGDLEAALGPAAGLECLHTYSLVHDDLPCMDDDDLRRGRPTVHRAFDEATAVLVGDALQTLAFLAVAPAGGEAVSVLARAAGSEGMVAGQAADVAAEGQVAGDCSAEEVGWIHDHKTGALIAASLEIGLLAGGGPGAARAPLREYGRLIGRAFQIADDCLDLTGAAEELGKQPGQDLAAAKLTYPAVLGVTASLVEARRLVEEAAALAPGICASAADKAMLDPNTALLQDVALFIVSRKT